MSPPTSYTWPLLGTSGIDATPAAIDPTLSVDYIPDWAAHLRARFYQQFKNKPNLQAVSDDVLAPQFQAIEDTAQQLLTIMSIDASVGVQLDNIGKLVGQLRGGVDDATYRLYLRAKIRANKSSGTPNDVYAVFLAMFNSAMGMFYEKQPPASFMLRFLSPVTTDQEQVAIKLLGKAKAAGDRAVLEYILSPADTIFKMAGPAAFLTSLALNSSTTLHALIPASYPSTGSLVLDVGTPDEETVVYTSRTATQFDLSSGTANDHDANSIAITPYAAGRGWGDDDDPSAGGHFAGADLAL